MQFTKNGFEYKPGILDSELGHTYTTLDEKLFYRLLQNSGFKHVEDPDVMLRQTGPCYTVNCGHFLVPKKKVKGGNGIAEFEQWYPDAIIRSASGKFHFVELKSHGIAKPDKYGRFTKFYVAGVVGNKMRGTYANRLVKEFRRKFGKPSFHLLARVKVKTNLVSTSRPGDARAWKSFSVVKGTAGEGMVGRLFDGYKHRI